MLEILDLSPEVIYYMIKYWYIEDIRAFSSCSTYCYQLLRHFSWTKISKCWPTIKKMAFSSSIFQNLKFTMDLSITAGEYWKGKYPLLKGNTHKKLVNFQCILEHCDVTKLKKLFVEEVLTDECLKIVGGSLRNLQELKLMFSVQVTENGWEKISRLHHLRILRLENCVFDDNGISKIAKIQCLEELHFSSCGMFSEHSMSRISSANKLKKLTVSVCDFTGIGLNYLAVLPALTHLDLSFTCVTDNALILCAEIVTLQSMKLAYCKNLTNAGLSYLSSLTMLQDLDLSYWHSIHEQGLSNVSNLITLKKLAISGDYNTNKLSQLYGLKLNELKILNNRFPISVINQLCEKTGLVDTSPGVFIRKATKVLIKKS